MPNEATTETPTEPETIATSALADALRSVGDRWTLLIVAALLDHPSRFGDLQRELAGIAPNVLSGRLQKLEHQGLVVAEPYQERPPRFVYELADWGARNAGGAEPPVHAACGSPLEATWYCPTCQEPVADDQARDLHFA